MVNSNSPVFLFAGTERYLKERALNELRASLLTGSSTGLDYKIFYGDEASMKEVLDYAATASIFSAHRLIVLRDPERLSREDRSRLSDYIKNPIKSATLVVDAKDDALTDELDAGLRGVKILRFDKLTDEGIARWIEKFLISAGKHIEPNALEVLRVSSAENLMLLSTELEKLIAFMGKRECITLGDVESVVGKNVVSSAFDLAWMIGEKNAGGSLKLAGALASEGKRAHEIIGLLSWHLTRLLKAKALKRIGKPAPAIASSLKIAKRYQAQFFKQVDLFGVRQIETGIKILLDADLDVKRTRLDPRLVVELAILRLCLG